VRTGLRRAGTDAVPRGRAQVLAALEGGSVAACTIRLHAVERWRERVSPDSDRPTAYNELRDFLAGARLDVKPPSWVHTTPPPRAVRLGRADETRINTNPYPPPLYAINPLRSDVCVVVARDEPPAAVSVLTKRAAKAARRAARRYVSPAGRRFSAD
jgi:hypothetical protein